MKFTPDHLAKLSEIVQPQLRIVDHCARVIGDDEHQVLVIVLRVKNADVAEPFDMVFTASMARARQLGINLLAYVQ